MPEETSATTQNSTEATEQTSLLSGSETVTTTQTEEVKTEQTDTKDATVETTKEETKAEPVVPEKYEFKMPEGVKLDTAAVEAFEPIARDLKLTQDQAQKLVDLQVETVKRAQVAQAEAWATQQKSWQEEVKSDKEIGGVNLEPSLNAAKAVLKQYGDAELVKSLDASGMGNNPHLIRLLVKVGKAMSEDTFKSGSSSAKADPIKALYPNSQMT